MDGIERRGFLKLVGTATGAALAVSLFHDRLLAGELGPTGLDLFEQRFGVTREVVRKVLEAALSKGGSFADLYFEYRTAGRVVMEDDIVRESAEDVTLGVGVRVQEGRQTGYGFTSDLSLDRMREAALTAAAIAASTGARKLPALRDVRVPGGSYSLAEPLTTAALGDKLGLLREAYAAALGHDPRVRKAVVTLTDELQHVAMVDSEGRVAADARPQARLVVSATAEDKGVRVTGLDNAGGRVGRAFFARPGTTPREIGRRAAEEAVTLLSAVDPRPGDQPVVCGSRNSGVMVHEAVGHPFEADGVWRQTSIMHDRLGQMVASPLVTIYDDATIPFFRGSLDVDDEGTPTRKVVMVEEGRLTSFLHDRLSARLLGVEPNGHGRRQSFQSPAIPRMNNTVLAAGKASREDIIRSVRRGFYADTYAGGEVQGTGKFTFSVNLGYLIEDGRLTAPVRNATLVGTNLQVLKDIEMIGDDTAFFLGTCGKGGQNAPVTAGTPTFKIRQMTVGGRA